MSKSKTATKTAATKTATAAHRKTAATSKANATKTAQPGIISAIMFMLCEARDKKAPITVNGMLDKLEAKFERPRNGLQTTVRAQLSRLPNERKFGVVKQRIADSIFVGYSADAKAKPNAPKVSAA